MFFDAKFFTLLAFIIINFLIIFKIKNRTTIVTALIISHLVAVLFFSLSISNYNSFKEIVLALIVFSMVILFLVSNYNPIYLQANEASEFKLSKYILFFAPVILLVFLASFLVIKNVTKIAELTNEKKISSQEEIIKNPMILPNHAVHIAVKKFYFGKKFEEELSDKTYVELEINERKRARLKDKLSDNFLLKRSSDVILMIVAVSTILLLLSGKKNEKNSWIFTKLFGR